MGSSKVKGPSKTLPETENPPKVFLRQIERYPRYKMHLLEIFQRHKIFSGYLKTEDLQKVFCELKNLETSVMDVNFFLQWSFVKTSYGGDSFQKEDSKLFIDQRSETLVRNCVESETRSNLSTSTSKKKLSLFSMPFK